MKKILGVTFALLMLAGCSGPSGGDNNATDTGTEDETGVDACTPKTSCSSNQCGMVSDGCGGTIECEEACRCEDGSATVTTCGPCDLGRVVCSAGETGEGECESPEVLGLSADADASTCEEMLIFVDKATTEQTQDGTRETPFRSLSAALGEAQTGQTIVIGREVEYAKEGGFDIKDGVSLVGGFGGSPEFVYQPEKRPTLRGRAATDSDVLGLKAEGLTEETLVANVYVENDDAAAAPAEPPVSNYGVWVRDSEGLRMVNVDVQAGAAGDGVSGEDGDRGSQASQAPATPTPGVRENTEGGKSNQCPSANGGQGGKGGYNTPDGDLLEPEEGEGTQSAQGGAPGTATTRAGDNGSLGDSGSAGDDGGAGLLGGSTTDGLWRPDGYGGDGSNGEEGDGGGGGGGAWPRTCLDNDDPYYGYYYGPNGAGGGAGGCGGRAGTGGAPGGGSFGLFVVNSNVETTASNFSSATGGDGGAGGTGGDGGPGQEGGVGAIIAAPEQTNGGCQAQVSLTYKSGDGGDGGAGGRGGHGGGGAGGVSYGVYCENSTLNAQEDVTFEAGSPGAGGASDGVQGVNGEAAGQKGCE